MPFYSDEEPEITDLAADAELWFSEESSAKSEVVMAVYVALGEFAPAEPIEADVIAAVEDLAFRMAGLE